MLRCYMQDSWSNSYTAWSLVWIPSPFPVNLGRRRNENPVDEGITGPLSRLGGVSTLRQWLTDWLTVSYDMTSCGTVASPSEWEHRSRGSITRQWLVKTAEWEDFVCGVVNCSVCKLVIMLDLRSASLHSNPITNTNPIYSHSYMWHVTVLSCSSSYWTIICGKN
jgi:hypothetical protein